MVPNAINLLAVNIETRLPLFKTSRNYMNKQLNECKIV